MMESVRGRYVPVIWAGQCPKTRDEVEMARVNADGSVTIADWEVVRHTAMHQPLDPTIIGCVEVPAIARLLLAARDNFIETPMKDADEIAARAYEKIYGRPSEMRAERLTDLC